MNRLQYAPIAQIAHGSLAALHLSTDTLSQSATTRQSSYGAGFSDIPSTTRQANVADKKSMQPSSDAGCRAVADKTPPQKEMRVALRLIEGLVCPETGGR